MDPLQNSYLCQRLSMIMLLMVDCPDTDADRWQQLADEANELCRQLGQPLIVEKPNNARRQAG